MKRSIKTNVISESETKQIDHHFFPALALEIGLRNGLKLNQRIIQTVVEDVKRNMDGGYLRWDNSRPPDYDDTITARNLLELVDRDEGLSLQFSSSKEGGIYTYVGGLRSRKSNSVDLLINLRILEYLKRKSPKSKEYKRLLNFLGRKKDDFKRPIREISKYYLSEGFLLYSLSFVYEDLSLDLEELARLKEKAIKHPTDINLKNLALGRGKAVKSKKPLELFDGPSLKERYSCSYFDFVVEKCARK